MKSVNEVREESNKDQNNEREKERERDKERNGEGERVTRGRGNPWREMLTFFP